MALPKRTKTPPYNQVLKLVEQLPLNKQEQLRLTLDRKSRYKEWRDLVNATATANKGQLPIADDEILAEVKAVKQARKARLAKNSNRY